MNTWISPMTALAAAGLLLGTAACNRAGLNANNRTGSTQLEDRPDRTADNVRVPETNDQPTSAAVRGYVFQPAQVDATDERVRQLNVPDGFTIVKFAENLGKPRMLTVSDRGNVYVADREAGTVTLLRDTNNDGRADDRKVVAKIKDAHGLTIHDGKLYVVTITEVYAVPMQNDGTLGEPKRLISDLPDGGQHPNRTIAFGPDNKMYITVGSTCNACVEPNDEHATVLRANADGSNRTIYAKGLRNTIGFGWHPQTKELYGFDHGIDWLGDDENQEEFNLIREGAHYGWPHVYENGKYNPYPRPKGDTTYQQFAAKTTNPLLLYKAHSAPLGMVFYTPRDGATARFPRDYENDAIVTMRGSWNRSNPSGYNLVRVHFENGKPTRITEFVTGFLTDNNRAQFGRPVGIAQHPDGSLLFTDDTNGVMYRVAYRQ